MIRASRVAIVVVGGLLAATLLAGSVEACWARPSWESDFIVAEPVAVGLSDPTGLVYRCDADGHCHIVIVGN